MLKVTGPELETLEELATRIEDLLLAHPDARDVRNPLGVKRTDLQVAVDPDRLALLGLDPLTVDRTVRAGVAGLEVGRLRDGEGEESDIVMRFPFMGHAPSPADLNWVTLQAPSGGSVPLSQVATVELTPGSGRIDHYDTRRVATVTAYPVGEASALDVTRDITAELESMDFPRGYEWFAGGTFEEQQEGFGGMIRALMVAVLGIFAVLVLQFRSFLQPLIIFASVPLAFVGAVLALLFTGYSFSFTAFIGITSLVGIVINNSIILVDYANRRIAAGDSVDEALRRAGEVRFQPIVLTTVTTVGGLLPLTLTGSSLWSPLGWTIIGGLLTSDDADAGTGARAVSGVGGWGSPSRSPKPETGPHGERPVELGPGLFEGLIRGNRALRQYDRPSLERVAHEGLGLSEYVEPTHGAAQAEARSQEPSGIVVGRRDRHLRNGCVPPDGVAGADEPEVDVGRDGEAGPGQGQEYVSPDGPPVHGTIQKLEHGGARPEGIAEPLAGDLRLERPVHVESDAQTPGYAPRDSGPEIGSGLHFFEPGVSPACGLAVQEVRPSEGARRMLVSTPHLEAQTRMLRLLSLNGRLEGTGSKSGTKGDCDRSPSMRRHHPPLDRVFVPPVARSSAGTLRPALRTIENTDVGYDEGGPVCVVRRVMAPLLPSGSPRGRGARIMRARFGVPRISGRGGRVNHTEPQGLLSRRELMRRSAGAGAFVLLGACRVEGDVAAGVLGVESDAARGPVSGTADARPEPTATAFYLDSFKGDDASDGTTSRSAWRTLARLEDAVGRGELGPGDTVRVAGGSSFARDQKAEGPFWFEQGIRYEGWGSGDKPRFLGAGDRPFGIRGHGTSLMHLRFIGGGRSVLHTDGTAPVNVQLEDVDCLGGGGIGLQQLSGAGPGVGSVFLIRGGSFSDNATIGINITGARDTLIDGATAARNGTVGIRLQSSGTGCVIRGCLTHDNGANGIGVDTPREGGGGEIIEGNEVFGNARLVADRSGIKTFSSGTVIRYNEVYENGAPGTLNHGIQLEAGSDSCVCYGNICHGNPTVGISFTGAGHRLYHNTCHANGESGLATFSTSVTDCEVKNNLLVDNGRFSFRSHGSVTVSSITVDHNLHESGGGAAVIRLDGVDYPTLAALHAAHGLESHGVEGGARMARNTRRVPPRSTAVGNGDADVGVAQDFDGRDYRDPPTIGALEVQGGG